MQLRIYDRIGEISPKAWDALRDSSATPFTRWAWLDALESSGCADEQSGWRPRHLTLWRHQSLIAAAPAYVKEDSDGDFSRDWGWAEAAQRARIAYYPKLVVTVPFTPVTGQRLLIAPGEDRAACIEALFGGIRDVRSIHVLFPSEREATELEALGMAKRLSFQYHWRNRGYRDPEGFLACFSSKKRNQAKRERAAPAEQGITLRTVRDEELARERRKWAHAAHELHRSTVDKLMWGRRWLNRAFYERVFDAMPEDLEVVAAERDGRLVAGAFNLHSPTHLWGRYWGCFEEHRFLHFNVCLYHSIDECIRRGVEVFEGGAGGEHKIARGFEPAETWSAHRFLDPRLSAPFAGYIEKEAEERQRALERWRAESPIIRRAPKAVSEANEP